MDGDPPLVQLCIKNLAVRQFRTINCQLDYHDPKTSTQVAWLLAKANDNYGPLRDHHPKLLCLVTVMSSTASDNWSDV